RDPGTLLLLSCDGPPHYRDTPRPCPRRGSPRHLRADRCDAAAVVGGIQSTQNRSRSFPHCGAQTAMQPLRPPPLALSGRYTWLLVSFTATECGLPPGSLMLCSSSFVLALITPSSGPAIRSRDAV